MALDKLILLGCDDVQTLEEIRYTDGITYTLEKNSYFACRDGKGIVIYNSKLQELKNDRNDQVYLRITSAVSTVQNDTTLRRIKTTLNLKKIHACIHAARAHININEICGIIPVFTHAAPSSVVSYYKIELEEMRNELIAANKSNFKSLDEAWREINHPNGGRGENTQAWTEAERAVLATYETRNTDGAIRKRGTEKNIGSNTSTLTGVIDGNMVTVNICRHRSYMWTWMQDKRRDHQGEIDHIDGNHSNNCPWNLRWLSREENCLAKHSRMTDRSPEIPRDIRDSAGAKKWNGWTFFTDTMILRPDGKRFIARMLKSRSHYPSIGPKIKNPTSGETKQHMIKCHLLKAFLYRIPTSPLASIYLETTLGMSRTHFDVYGTTYFQYLAELKRCGLVVMHLDHNKANYSTDNLKIGTPSENAHDRHDNPNTTGRKCVLVIDLVSGDVVESFASRKEAAASFGIALNSISEAVRINKTRRIGTYRETLNRKTGLKYAFLDAA